MKPVAVLSLLAAAAALAGCAGGGIAPTPAGQELVSFAAPALAAPASRRVTFADAWQEEEYVRFDGGKAQAEIVYAAADERDSIVLNFELTLDDTIATWRAFSPDARSRGETGAVATPLATFQYGLFTQAAGDRPCVGFLSEWDYRAGDPQLRPAKVLFGYYCGDAGTALTADRVEGLLAGIRIAGVWRTDYRFTPRLDFVAAASGGTPMTGNRRFPFVLADRFVDADGEVSGG